MTVFKKTFRILKYMRTKYQHPYPPVVWPGIFAGTGPGTICSCPPNKLSISCVTNSRRFILKSLNVLKLMHSCKFVGLFSVPMGISVKYRLWTATQGSLKGFLKGGGKTLNNSDFEIAQNSHCMICYLVL